MQESPDALLARTEAAADGRERGRKMATTWSSFTISAAFSCRARGQQAIKPGT